MIVARLESSRDLKDVCHTLQSLNYEVALLNSKIAFVFRGNSTLNDLRSDITSAKKANKFNVTIKVIYGANSASM